MIYNLFRLIEDFDSIDRRNDKVKEGYIFISVFSLKLFIMYL